MNCDDVIKFFQNLKEKIGNKEITLASDYYLDNKAEIRKQGTKLLDYIVIWDESQNCMKIEEVKKEE